MSKKRANVPARPIDLDFERAGFGLCLAAPNGAVLAANAEWFRSTGNRPEQVIGKDVLDFLPATREVAAALHARARAGEFVDVPAHRRRVAGRDTWWEGSIAPVPMEGGTGLLITAREIAEQGRRDATASTDTDRPSDHDLQSLFPGESELARRMRALDWSATDLGPPTSWPENLRIAVRICVASRFPIVLWWGPNLTLLYNDAYVPFLGETKHPRFLGKSGRECWSDIWDTIGPMHHHVWATGTATWSEDLLFFFARRLPREEVYVTFTFSPIFARDGRTVQGTFCACTETTERVVGARRLETLRKLGLQAAEARTIESACAEAAAVLASNPHDIPFAAIYVVKEGTHAEMSASAGLPDPSLLPTSASRGERRSPWELGSVLEARCPREISGLETLARPIPGGPWPEPATKALVLPIPGPTHGTLAGLLVVGVSPRRVLDPGYRTFFDLVAAHIGTALADATAYEAERRRAEALAELDRAKTTFFSNVSHEFRTPLTLLLGPIEEALATRASALTGESLQSVHRNALRLLKLVNALLDFSRIEAGRVQAVYEPVDLPVLTADLASSFRSAIEKAGISLEVSCPADTEPAWVDREMWEKIVLNLLSNAFKFTFEGHIRVSLERTEQRWELRVADTGVGIPVLELPRLFERFHRVEGQRSRTHEGSGIGLALVLELARMHGGAVGVSSELRRGSTFTVAFPRGHAHLPADRIGAERTLASTALGASPFVEEAMRWLPELPRPHTTRAEEAPGPASSATRVLFADDNADMRAYVRRLLSEHWNVETVVDGEEALAAARARRPDLVLTDVMMPKLDGFGVIQAVRADATLRSIPVILVSARAGEESRVEGLEAGADDYLVKPFSSRELVARVRTHLELARSRSEAERRRAEVEAASQTKDEFIAMLGHELRNPLAPILTALQLMRLEGRSGFERERTIIERQVRQLVSLVDDLLDVSRITQGKLQLQRQPVEISAVVTRAIEIAGPLLEQRHHQLAIDVECSGLSVDGDPERLAQIFANLLTNAAKYTDSGGHVSVAARREDGEIVTRVGDDGVGIAAGLLPHVFDLFVQGRRALDRAPGGLGLGLAIVRSLVELHGGTVAAESTVGLGSTFTVRLPAARAAATTVTARDRPIAAVDSGCRVLVVDDNHDAADVLVVGLEALGFSAQAAYDGPEALEAAATFAPQVVLLDIGLPVMDGYEVAERLRADPASRDVRLVALTGYGAPSDRAAAERAGFDAHLTKPVGFDRVVSVIETVTHG